MVDGSTGGVKLRGQPELGGFSYALHTVAAYSRALCHDGSAAFTQRGIDRRESFPVTPTVNLPPAFQPSISRGFETLSKWSCQKNKSPSSGACPLAFPRVSRREPGVKGMNEACDIRDRKSVV